MSIARKGGRLESFSDGAADPAPAPAAAQKEEPVLLSPPVSTSQQPSAILRDLEQEVLVLRNLRNHVTEQVAKLQFEAYVLTSLENKYTAAREQQQQQQQPQGQPPR